MDKKKFKEDQDYPGVSGGEVLEQGPVKLIAAEELKGTGLMLKGCGDSSSGSESAPSDDNLQPEDNIKIIPVIDKKTKRDLELKKQQ